MQMASQKSIIPSAFISQKIFFVRGTRVMLDADSPGSTVSRQKT
jgi:hypothetical protein